jgi:hypothetical protein
MTCSPLMVASTNRCPLGMAVWVYGLNEQTKLVASLYQWWAVRAVAVC